MKFFLLILSICISGVSVAQTNQTDKEFEEAYQKRIRKSRIGETYIPKDYQDAFIELGRLSTKADLQKFKGAQEDEVAKKLHFGLGKWMMVNWSFYEGSRYSHFLKKQGLHYPDDMAQVTIRLFHRHLNEKDLMAKELIAEYAEARTKAYQEELKDQEVIDSFRRKRE